MEAEDRLDPKLLYRRLDGLLGAFDPARPGAVLMRAFLGDAFRSLGEDLRLKAGTLYAERRDEFERTDGVGDESRGMPDALDCAASVLRLVLEHGVYIFDAPFPGEGKGEPALPWPSAAVVVGMRPSRHVLWFALRRGWVREELDFALNTIRAALGSRLADERVRGSFRQAAQIQQSLLLDEPPAFPGYELAARSIAAEEVGGDFYDFFSFGDDLLGLAIGDASGHGLPAALLVRDVVTGLRMGLEKDLKMGYVFAKLNRVIHRSNLSSRFVSVFYGELEETGNLIYVNAGHPPALIFTAARRPPRARHRRHGDRAPAGGAVPARHRLPRAGRRARAHHGRDPGAARPGRRVLRAGRGREGGARPRLLGLGDPGPGVRRRGGVRRRRTLGGRRDDRGREADGRA